MARKLRGMRADGGSNLQGQRLDSWKEIALFFGRDERTVKRWEARRGLPICRLPGGGKTTVYAYVAELEEWLKNGGGAGEAVAASLSPEAPLPSDPSSVVPRSAGSGASWFGIGRTRAMAAAAVVLATVAAASLGLWIRSERGRPVSLNVAANGFYLKGLYSWQTRTPAGLAQAIDDFRAAIAHDPNFAPAYAGLADCYNLMPEYTDMPAAVAFPKAKAAAMRAIALDDDLAGAHLSLAFVDFWWSHDGAGAMREFRRAEQLDPRSSQAHHWYANVLGMMGDRRGAMTEIGYAEDLAPGSTAIQADKGILLVDAGRNDEAVQVLKQVATAEPNFAPAHAYLADAYMFQNNGPAALREMRRHAELVHDAAERDVAVAGERGYKAGGLPEMTRRIAAKEQELVDGRKYSAYALAVTYSRRGDRERALLLLTTAVQRRDTLAMGMRIEPSFRDLHGDPRFAALLVREGLPPFSGM